MTPCGVCPADQAKEQEPHVPASCLNKPDKSSDLCYLIPTLMIASTPDDHQLKLMLTTAVPLLTEPTEMTM